MPDVAIPPPTTTTALPQPSTKPAAAGDGDAGFLDVLCQAANASSTDDAASPTASGRTPVHLFPGQRLASSLAALDPATQQTTCPQAPAQAAQGTDAPAEAPAASSATPVPVSPEPVVTSLASLTRAADGPPAQAQVPTQHPSGTIAARPAINSRPSASAPPDPDATNPDAAPSDTRAPEPIAAIPTVSPPANLPISPLHAVAPTATHVLAGAREVPEDRGLSVDAPGSAAVHDGQAGHVAASLDPLPVAKLPPPDTGPTASATTPSSPTFELPAAPGASQVQGQGAAGPVGAADAPAPVERPQPAGQLAPALVALVQADRPGAAQPVVIRLAPPELGHVQLRIERPADGPAHVVLAVERPDTLMLLLQDRPQLDRALDTAGIAPEGRTLQFSLGTGDTGGESGGRSRPDQALGGPWGTLVGPTSPAAERQPAPRWRQAGIDLVA